MKELRNQRKENNQCVYCAGPMDRKGIYCIKCNDYWNEYRHTHYTLKKHESGKCTNCGADLDREGWFCSICVNKLRLRGKALADYRRKNSLCVQCGIPISEYSYCRKHLNDRMDRYHAKRNNTKL